MRLNLYFPNVVRDHALVFAFFLPYGKYFSILQISKDLFLGESDMMFNLNSCIEVFGVHVEPQTSVLFATVNKAVELLCLFTFFDLHYNDISCLVPF